MERQRSFSLKSTRFLVLSLTIFSSLVFFTFFSLSFFNAKPLIYDETHLPFRKPSFNIGLEPSNVRSFSGSTRDFSTREVKNAIPVDNHIKKPEILSEIPNLSGIEELPIKGGQTERSADLKTVGGILTVLSANYSASGVENPILISEHLTTPENASVFPNNSVIDEVQDEEEREPQEADNGVSTDGAINGNIVLQQTVLDTSSPQKTEALSSKLGIEEKNKTICDVTKGKWVFDESYPLYTNVSCPFIDEGFNCEGNGRLDKDYMKWRWQPQDCDIPRFDAVKMLELIRGKRLVFVGDSINRNQWESMLCLLMGAVKNPKRVYESRGRKITKEKGNYSFKFVDYQCTVEYYVTHFLVHESKGRIGKKRVPTLRIDSIDRASSRWKGADILVFNTAHWWNHYKTKAGSNYYQEKDQVHPHLDVSTAYQRALITWASWVDRNTKPSKTQVFFRSSAPSHFRGGQWNSGGHCTEATQPLNETSSISYPEKNLITEKVIRQMKTPVTLLNVTTLSQYRIDGHPSVYGKKLGSGSSSIQDCSHWCLPGVPDTWNELLYFHLQSKRLQSLT